MAAAMIVRETIEDSGVSHIFVTIQWPWFKDHPILSKRRASPMRLVRAVIIPAPSDFGFW